MAKQDLAVEQILATIKKQQEALNALQDSLYMRARLQEYTEIQFNELVRVARRGIECVQKLEKGEVVSAEWIAEREEIVELARRLIQDED